MRVKVQYTADIEDVPREVAKLLPKMLDFTPEVADIEGMVMNGKTIKAIETLYELRKTLFQVDQRLADSQQILKGYLGVTVGQSSGTNEGEEDDSAS